VEQRKLGSAARAAAWLVVAELETVLARIDSAIATGEWWDGILPDAAWRSHVNDLSYEAQRLNRASPTSQAFLRRLAAAYGLVERWNSDRSLLTHDALTSGETASSLAKTREAIAAVIGELAEVLRPKQWYRARVRRRRGLVVLGPPILGLALAIGSIALFVPRPDLNVRTVAASLQSGLRSDGVQADVECDPHGDDWRCTAVRTSVIGGARCPQLTSLTASGLQSAFRTVAATTRGIRCPIERTVYEASQTPDGSAVSAVPVSASASNQERAIRVGSILAKIAKDSAWRKLVRWWNGE
jgi:hypothetical protein